MLQDLKHRLRPPALQPYRTALAFDEGAYYAQVAANYRGFTNGTRRYEELLELVDGLEHARVVPLYELAAEATDDAPRIALRHDIDADPAVALALARRLARRGVCASFFVLHSATYYANRHGDVMVRNAGLAPWLRAMIVAGCELGLHNDALGMFWRDGFDPVQVLQSELEFLRAHGAVIRGTVAHNSVASQRAENYELFEERVLWPRRLRREQGQVVELGATSMAALGLSYEGTFARPRGDVDRAAAAAFAEDDTGADLRSESWMRTYLTDNPICEWDVDFQVWVIGRDRWVIAGGRERRATFEWDIRFADLGGFLAALPPGSRTMFVLHPEYFGDYAE